MPSRESSTTAPTGTLGRNLRKARLAKGWTQGQLAGDNYSVGFISRIESGGRQPSRTTLTALANRLGVTVEYLLNGVEHGVELSLRYDLDRAELSLAGGDCDEACSITAGLIADDSLAPWPELDRRAHLVHALALEALGDVHAAIIELEDLLEVAGEDGDLTATVGIAVSRCYRDAGDFALSIKAGERAMSMLDDLGLSATSDYIRLAVTVAAAYFESGEVGVATRLSRRTIANAEENGSPEAQASAYWNASIIERHAGNLDGALRLGSRALAILQNGASTVSLGKLRTQLALFHIRMAEPNLVEARTLLEMASRELDWSSVGPLDASRHLVALVRLHMAEGDQTGAREMLARIAPEVCHQDAALAAEILVLRVLVDILDGTASPDGYPDATSLLDMLGNDRGTAQLWFELGEAMERVGEQERALVAFRKAATCFGASRVLLPASERPSFVLTSVG